GRSPRWMVRGRIGRRIRVMASSSRFAGARIGILLFCLLATVVAAAHAQSATGDVQGTVRDESGAVLPGVAITIVNTATETTRETATDADGLFAVPGLPVGLYELTATLEGFATGRQPVVRGPIGGVGTLR